MIEKGSPAVPQLGQILDVHALCLQRHRLSFQYTKQCINPYNGELSIQIRKGIRSAREKIDPADKIFC